MANYSNEAMIALAEFIKASDKCSNEPDETYGAVFIEIEPKRKRLEQFFTSQERSAIIVNMSEIKKILCEAGLIPE